MLINRLLLMVILSWAVFFGPWWLVAILVGVGFIFYQNYYEGLVVVLVVDVVYGGGAAWLFGLPMFLTLVATVLFLILPPLRYRLLWS